MPSPSPSQKRISKWNAFTPIKTVTFFRTFQKAIPMFMITYGSVKITEIINSKKFLQYSRNQIFLRRKESRKKKIPGSHYRTKRILEYFSSPFFLFIHVFHFCFYILRGQTRSNHCICTIYVIFSDMVEKTSVIRIVGLLHFVYSSKKLHFTESQDL
jgi:hypothetical protein